MARITITPPGLPTVDVDAIDQDLEFDYLGTDRKVTRRLVTVHRATGHQALDGTIELEDIRGYCHLRKMARTFRVERVSNVVTVDGEVVSDLTAWILGLANGDGSRTGA